MSVGEFLRHPFSKGKREQAKKKKIADEIARIDRQLSQIKDYMVDAPSPMGGYYTMRRSGLRKEREKLTGTPQSSQRRRTSTQ